MPRAIPNPLSPAFLFSRGYKAEILVLPDFLAARSVQVTRLAHSDLSTKDQAEDLGADAAIRIFPFTLCGIQM